MTIDELRRRLDNPLPGEDAHMEFSPMRGKSSELLKTHSGYRESAVAIILYIPDRTSEVFTIVTERQVYNGQHSGQISFPGGKKEPEDVDLMETATRECFEEIGFCLTRDEFIRQLTPVFIPVSNFLVFPNVFITRTAPRNFVISEREVAGIHQLNLNQLFDPGSVTYRNILLQNNLKLNDIPHFSQNEVHIWGATALILNELKQLLQLP